MQSLYSLLQITDSLFPAGAFAHSGGLEGLLQTQQQTDGTALWVIVESIWKQQLLRVDGLIGFHVHRAMRQVELERVCTLDRQLTALKLTRELRDASLQTGRSFITEAARLVPSPVLATLQTQLLADESAGNYATAFMAVAAAAGVDEDPSFLAWGYQSIAQLSAALLRLGVVGHRVAARLVADMRSVVEEGLAMVRSFDAANEVSGFAPLLEIASMVHEQQYSRLFRS